MSGDECDKSKANKTSTVTIKERCLMGDAFKIPFSDLPIYRLLIRNKSFQFDSNARINDFRFSLVARDLHYANKIQN